MAEVRIAATAELSTNELATLRRLVAEAFGGTLSQGDWDHASGGLHVVVLADREVVSHAAVVSRTLTAGGIRLPTGYVEAVATRADRRAQGHATRALREIGRIIQGGYQLGALSTGAQWFYERLGWERWRGPTFVQGPQGLTRTADEDDGVMVLRTVATSELDLTAPLTCDWRSGDVW